MNETSTNPLTLAAGWHTVRIEFEDVYDQANNGLVVSYDIGGGKESIPASALFTTQVTTFDYDAAGRLETLTDPNGNTTTYSYDTVNRLTSESIEIDSVPLTRSYEYDDNGNLIRQTDRNSRVTIYDYDDLNRLTNEYWLDEEQEIEQTISYEYDDNGNILSAGGGPTYEYLYDYLNRVTDITQALDGLDPAIQFQRGYDAAGRMISSSATIGLTDDYLHAYTYDTLGRVTSLTQTSQSGGNAVGNKRVDFDYNAANQLTALSRYASLSTASPVAETDYGYAAAGRLTSIAHATTATGSSFEETHSYTYDSANRATSYENIFGDFSTDYDYDATDQLTSEDLPGGSVDYTYDANGNRQSLNATTYEVGPYNRLLSDGTYGYEYDDEGNLIYREEISDPGNRTYYTWDHRNRLVHISELNDDHEVLIVDYVYDAFNQLIDEHVDKPFEADERSTVFVHDNGQIVLQFDKTGSGNLDEGDLAHRYMWGPAVDQLLADEQVHDLSSAMENETLWALTDHLGSVRDVVDDSGRLRLHRAFDAFGQITEETHYDTDGLEVGPPASQYGYVDVAFAFTGHYFDSDTGLQNNLNRWYDPTTGRWISEDPIGFAAGDPNLYRYVGNAPTNFTDPSGLAAAVAVTPWVAPWVVPALPAAAPAAAAVVVCPAAGYYAGDYAENRWGLGAAIGGWLVPYEGDHLEEVAEALRQFHTNKPFGHWCHREYGGEKIGGGGVDNPNLDNETIWEAWQEWLQNQSRPGQ